MKVSLSKSQIIVHKLIQSNRQERNFYMYAYIVGGK